MKRLLIGLAGVGALLVSSGCDRSPRLPTAALAPGSPQAASALGASDRGRGFERIGYPLAVGNRWIYDMWSRSTTSTASGILDETRHEWTREEQAVGWETRDGRRYVRIEMTDRDSAQTVQFVRWLRMDGEGLYESGVADPRLPGESAESSEKLLLAWPLRVGRHWVRSAVLNITARVERRERVRVGTGTSEGWRVCVDRQLEVVRENEWYGDEGLLAHSATFEQVRRLPDGGELRTRSAWGARLREARLVSVGPCADVVDEAREALLAIRTGEQVVYQRWAAYVDAPNSAAVQERLPVDLSSVFPRWEFCVVDVTGNGFTAIARGRRRTVAEGLVVRLTFVRPDSLTWSVEGCHDRGASR